MPRGKRWREGCRWLGVPATDAAGAQTRLYSTRGVRRQALVRQMAAAIEQRRAEGYSVRKIADKLGVAPITVQRWRRAAAAQEAPGGGRLE